MPPGVGVSGLESDGGDQFFCGDGQPSGGPSRHGQLKGAGVPAARRSRFSLVEPQADAAVQHSVPACRRVFDHLDPLSARSATKHVACAVGVEARDHVERRSLVEGVNDRGGVLILPHHEGCRRAC